MTEDYLIEPRNVSATTSADWLQSGDKQGPPSFLHVYPDILTREACREIIDRFDADQRARPSWGKNSDCPANRTGAMLAMGELEDWEDVVDEIMPAIEERIHHYAEVFLSFKRVLMSKQCALSRPLLERIVPGQGFDWHIDGSQPGIEKRVLAAIIYLADVVEGGETQFAYQMAEVAPQAGALVLFPPFWTHLHRGTTPKSGHKYNLTNFVVLRT